MGLPLLVKTIRAPRSPIPPDTSTTASPATTPSPSLLSGKPNSAPTRERPGKPSPAPAKPPPASTSKSANTAPASNTTPNHRQPSKRPGAPHKQVNASRRPATPRRSFMSASLSRGPDPEAEAYASTPARISGLKSRFLRGNTGKDQGNETFLIKGAGNFHEIPFSALQRALRRTTRLQPVVDSARGAGHPPFYWPGLRVLRFQTPARGALWILRHRDCRNLLDRDRDARPFRRVRRNLDGAQRPTQSNGLVHAVLDVWFPHRRARRANGAIVGRLLRLRIHRRNRARNRIYLAGLNANEVVPGPPRSRNRLGHHGFWRRRTHRLAPLECAAGILRSQPGRGNRSHIHHAGHRLPGVDELRGNADSHSTRRLGAGRIRSPRHAPKTHDRRASIGRQRD